MWHNAQFGTATRLRRDTHERTNARRHTSLRATHRLAGRRDSTSFFSQLLKPALARSLLGKAYKKTSLTVTVNWMIESI